MFPKWCIFWLLMFVQLAEGKKKKKKKKNKKKKNAANQQQVCRVCVYVTCEITTTNCVCM